VSFVLVSLASDPAHQILGAAVGMSAAIVTENTGTLLAVRKRLGFWPYNLTWLKPLSAGLLAAGAAYLVGVLVPLPGALPTIAVLGAVFSVGYLALLLLFGLSETDREFLGAFWEVARRLLRRSRQSGDAGGES
jgi:hypothetical protein